MDNTVKKVCYLNNSFDIENIIDDVECIVDTNFRYSEDEKSALVVKMLDGSYKIWIHDNEWKEF